MLALLRNDWMNRSIRINCIGIMSGNCDGGGMRECSWALAHVRSSGSRVLRQGLVLCRLVQVSRSLWVWGLEESLAALLWLLCGRGARDGGRVPLVRLEIYNLGLGLVLFNFDLFEFLKVRLLIETVLWLRVGVGWLRLRNLVVILRISSAFLTCISIVISMSEALTIIHSIINVDLIMF